MSLTEALIYGLPWWVQALGVAAAAIPALLFIARVIGAANALRLGAAAGAVLAALAYGRRQRQQGWSDRQAREERDAQDAIQVAQGARAAADASSGGLRDDDGFRRD
ncbi:hypothetical protein ABLE91_23750 [Aquabacter sp. CN5-332]|uniref:hypothetical protein n=1 Tax=Aquabacter sp. CN5-332 TaxID=3156608 RepID=UPI0032B493B9